MTASRGPRTPTNKDPNQTKPFASSRPPSEVARLQLAALVDRADRDPDVHAVVFTGTHPERFLSHSDVRWLQQGGVGFPPITTGLAGIVTRMARIINRVPILRTLARMTRPKSLLHLDSFHAIARRGLAARAR